jgi:aldehyde dehydrogenase (NAD+)
MSKFHYSQLYIDGQWVEPRDGATYPVPNPATEEEIGRAADASSVDMADAIMAARRAFDTGPWPRMPARDARNSFDGSRTVWRKRRTVCASY